MSNSTSFSHNCDNKPYLNRKGRHMHAVVNTLSFKDAVDPATFARVEAELVPAMNEVEGFAGVHIIQTGFDEITLVIFGADAATLDRLATEIGSPWMIANVVPLLSGPPNRKVGPVLASS